MLTQPPPQLHAGEPRGWQQRGTNTSGARTPSRWARDPPDNKSLFVDNALFADLDGDIGLVYHRPTPAGPVLVPTEPWESFGIVAYHSVVVNGANSYRLYYDTGWTMLDRTDWHRYTCLATSTDGVTWIKPNLGVSTFMNSTANNIVWPRDYQDNTHAAGTVFIDTNPAAPPDAKYKMVAQWNIGAVHPRGTYDAGVYMMKSADGIAFVPMFTNRSLDWSDTKNVMFWDDTLSKYVAYIRIDNYLPDPHTNDTCTLGFRPGRRVGRCLIDADQLHDWSLAGCSSHTGGGGLGDTECSVARSCMHWGSNYSAIRCDPKLTDTCKVYGTCGNVTSTCNATGFCTVDSGPELGPLCGKPSLKGTADVLSFDEQDPSCLDIYTSSATPYEDSGVILFFPSAYQHYELYGTASKNNDGLVDVRFATSRHVIDDAHYPPTRNGRSPFVPLGVNHCEVLVLATGAPRFDWCYNGAFATNGTSVNGGTVYMATGYLVSDDGSQLSLYSGGTPQSHGGGAQPPSPAPSGGKPIGHEGYMGQHSAVLRHTIRRDGFLGVEAGYGGANANQETWPQMLTVPLHVPNANACASKDVELRTNLLSGVGGGAYFAIEQNGSAVSGFTVHDAVLIAGNWIDARVGWGDDTSFATRVLTRFSGEDVQVRVALRDAELFSLTFGCVQRSRYAQCWKQPGCEAWGVGYATVPCETDEECTQFGSCGDVLSKCSSKFANVSHGERVCAIESGDEQGPVCGQF